MATQNPPIPRGLVPKFLDYRQSQILRELVDDVVRRARETLEREGCDAKSIDHEIAFALARAACRFDLDLLDGATANIVRLEAAVAELGARLEQAKLAQAIEGEARPREDAPTPADVARVSYENGTNGTKYPKK